MERTTALSSGYSAPPTQPKELPTGCQEAIRSQQFPGAGEVVGECLRATLAAEGLEGDSVELVIGGDVDELGERGVAGDFACREMAGALRQGMPSTQAGRPCSPSCRADSADLAVVVAVAGPGADSSSGHPDVGDVAKGSDGCTWATMSAHRPSGARPVMSSRCSWSHSFTSLMK